MSRYIDADKLKSEFDYKHNKGDCTMMDDLISRQAAIDAEDSK